MWHREAGLPLSTTTEGAPALPGQSIAQKTEAAREIEDPIDLVSLRVGRIDSVARHPEADTLYVLSVDLGERSCASTGDELLRTNQCRTIVSGLVPYYSPEQLQGLHAVTDGTLTVEILEAPASSRPGDRIVTLPSAETGACSDSSLTQALEKPLVKKQKLVDLFINGLSLDAGLLSYNGRRLVTECGGEISTRTMLAGVVR
ncbi:hypothetical protein GGI18_001150 [Coemansia linderi]|uniref:Uncharacterized protein n=1 Tax=Coemansia linderi TaxID=2663919 RepID=A0ACC1KLA9_9FUNG|nr:hypothetical protein GGI18_001150 [Coemansia linderi]